MRIEYELKFFHIPHICIQTIFEQATLIHERQFMRRYMFSVPHFAYPMYSLRIRDEGNAVVVTYKQNDGLKQIDSIKEQEMFVSDFENTCSFFQELGYKKEYYLESYRTKWKYKNCIITYDELPGLDPYIEIEGHSSHDVLGVAHQLHLPFDAGIPSSKISVMQLYKQVYSLTDQQMHQIKEFCFNTIQKTIEQIKKF
jgi:adenylate cyclase class 2